MLSGSVCTSITSFSILPLLRVRRAHHQRTRLALQVLCCYWCHWRPPSALGLCTNSLPRRSWPVTASCSHRLKLRTATPFDFLQTTAEQATYCRSALPCALAPISLHSSNPLHPLQTYTLLWLASFLNISLQCAYCSTDFEA